MAVPSPTCGLCSLMPPLANAQGTPGDSDLPWLFVTLGDAFELPLCVCHMPLSSNATGGEHVPWQSLSGPTEEGTGLAVDGVGDGAGATRGLQGPNEGHGRRGHTAGLRVAPRAGVAGRWGGCRLQHEGLQV